MNRCGLCQVEAWNGLSHGPSSLSPMRRRAQPTQSVKARSAFKYPHLVAAVIHAPAPPHTTPSLSAFCCSKPPHRARCARLQPPSTRRLSHSVLGSPPCGAFPSRLRSQRRCAGLRRWAGTPPTRAGSSSSWRPTVSRRRSPSSP
jgi:hypothetical protein